jgi:hypothetical protein
LDLWSGQRPKFDVLPDPIFENENPAVRFLVGSTCAPGRERRSP